ncbi:hypothetical protein WFJ11_00350 [Parvimonas micra]|uniref:hypothetical protein n=1 Tax=Parvimonas micra TaxID=33033 RepID=UPI0030D13BB4
METKNTLPKIVFTLSLISFCITILLFSVNYFTDLVDNLDGIYFLVLSMTTLILLAFSMYFTRKLSKIYSIINVILFLITFNIKHIMTFLLVLGGKI